MISKTNKIRFIAKMMLLVFLVTGAISLSGCVGGMRNRIITFNSNAELLDFVEEYNSKNDGFVYTFISFDFDNHEDVNIYEYTFRGVWSVVYNPFNKRDDNYRKIYDKDRSNGLPFDCKYVFYMDDICAQVICEYETPKDYNFYQSDIELIELVEAYSFNELDNDNKKRFDIYGHYENFLEDFADVRSRIPETSEYENYYSYMYIYRISINGTDEISIKLCTENKLNQEKLDEICQLLLDNLVIINTEG